MAGVDRPPIEILDSQDGSLRFKISRIDVSVANALRRTMIAEVETLAITTVTIERILVFCMTNSSLIAWGSYRLGIRMG